MDFIFARALVTRNLFRISSVLAGCASEREREELAVCVCVYVCVCTYVCTYGESTIELSATMGNPLIPAHEFTLPDRLIPYEITIGHPRRGLGLTVHTYTRAHGDSRVAHTITHYHGVSWNLHLPYLPIYTHDACGAWMQN